MALLQIAVLNVIGCGDCPAMGENRCGVNMQLRERPHIGDIPMFRKHGLNPPPAPADCPLRTVGPVVLKLKTEV